MQRVTPDRPWPLFDVAATRRAEQQAAAALAPGTLIQRAGLAVARLALAVAPHARTVWIACGPGNNGGDGMEAAIHLRSWGKDVHVTWLGAPKTAPADALGAWERARDAGVAFMTQPPASWDLGIDALLGIGANRAPDDAMRSLVACLNQGPGTVLAVDVPTGLPADTGAGEAVHARWTLSLLTLKPGLFTSHGRDACGEVWWDTLGIAADTADACAWLAGPAREVRRMHASHKGSYGDVAVVGGAPGMGGAALLAASAALHGGAGRVFVGLLDDAAPTVDAGRPELMLRSVDSLDLAAMAVACGCGGGDAVRAVLPRVLATAKFLVLDADALNAIAADSQLRTLLQARAGRKPGSTVITPHPLEAARLLGTTAAQVQADRLAATGQLAGELRCTVLLKGSGSVVADPQGIPAIIPTGNALLATAGTGDVLAGMVAAGLAAGAGPRDAACAAAFRHGEMADRWPADRPLTAAALARGL